MKSASTHSTGAIGILTVMVFSLVLVTLAVSLVFITISTRTNSLLITQSEQLFAGTEACAEEALIRLSRNSAYIGGSFSLYDVSCQVSVTGVLTTRNVSVTGTQGTLTHDLLIAVQLLPSFRITQWTD